MATYTVNATTDTGAALVGNAGELRACMAALADGDNIVFQSGLTGTIMLTSALPQISYNNTIDGTGALCPIDGAGAYQAFYFYPGATKTLNLTNLQIQNCYDGTPQYIGGAIDCRGTTAFTTTVNLTGCYLTGNSCNLFLVSVQGPGNNVLNMTRCTVANNVMSNPRGNAVYVIYASGNNASADLINCTFAGNDYSASGTSLSRLIAISGGTYSSSVTNCTISGNINSYGSNLALIQLTGTSAASLAVTNTITKGNTDIHGNAIAYGVAVLASGATGTVSYSDIDTVGGLTNGGNNITSGPSLGSLTLNAPATIVPTMAITSSSPAFETGTASGAPTTDARGVAVNSPPSMGAYQVSVAPAVANANVNATAELLTINFSTTHGPILPATGVTGLTWKKNGTPFSVTGAAISGTVYTATPSVTIAPTDTITFDYAPGNITDSSSNALGTITGQAVTNNATLPTAPAAPTGFTLSTTTISGTAPNPLDSTNSSTGYSVEYSTNGGSTWNVLTSTITAGSGNLTAGAAWSTGAIFTAGQSNIKLRYNAWNAVGNTEGTATAAQTMVDPAPVNLRVSGSTPTAVGLAWDADGGATGYNVKRRPTGSGSYSTVAGGGNVAGTTFSDTSVTPGVVYDYIVTALDGGGESAGSNVVTTGTAPDTPLAPTFGRIAQFQLVVVTPASFVSGALTYALQYANHGVNNWITFVSGLTAGAANTTVTGLASNTNYDFRFVATGASGTANGTVGSTYTERQIGMANPTVSWSQVGCQSLMIYPWANGAGPYNNTTGVTVQGIQGFTVGQEVKTAKLYGGESKYLLKSAQVQEDLTLKFGGGIINLEVWKLLLGGQLGVDPGSLSFQEVQYYTQSLIGDRGGYVRIVATSTNGDGTLIMVYPKCMVTSLNYDLKTDTVTILDMAADPNWDYTYVTQLGTTGAIYDAYWGQGNQTAPVS